MQSTQKTLLGFTILSVVAVGAVACSKKKSGDDNKSSESTFTVSGQLAISSNLEMASSMPDTVYALPAKVIENIYSFDKSMLQKFTVDGQGKFSAPVFSKSGDVLLVAIDSTATNRLDGIRGVLSLKDDSGSLLKIPAAEGTGSVDMGTLNQDSSGKEFKSDKKTDDVTSSFSIDVSKMKEIAKTDDSARGLINVVANIKDNGDFFFVKPYLVFKSSIQNIKNDFNGADKLTYSGYGLYFHAKWNGLTTESLCGGTSATNKLSLTPPTSFQPELCKENSTTNCTNYSELTNLSTGTIQTEGSGRSSCYSSGELPADGAFYTYKETRPGGFEAPVGFNWGGGGYKGTLPEGTWILKMNGSEVGRYNLSAANPLNANSKATVYVPSVKAVIENSKITRIEVKWFLWNSSTSSYEQVTNLETFQRLVTDVGAEIANYVQSRPCKINGEGTKSLFNSLSSSTNGVMSLDVSSFGASFPDSNYSTQSPSGCYAESIAIGYTMNGISYRFDFRPFY